MSEQGTQEEYITRNPNKKGRLIAGVAAMSMAVAALAACSNVDAETPRTDTSSSAEAPQPSQELSPEEKLQAEIDAGIEANRLTKEEIEIRAKDYPSIEEAVGAWGASQLRCLTTGNIKLSPDSRVNFSPTELLDVSIPRDFKLAENQEVCADALYDLDSVPKIMIDTDVSLNNTIVVGQFSEVKVTPELISVDVKPLENDEYAGAISYSLNVESSSEDGSGLVESKLGGDFRVMEDGTLKVVGPYSG